MSAQHHRPSPSGDGPDDLDLLAGIARTTWLEAGFRTAPSEAARAEAGTLQLVVRDDALEDLRHLPWTSIDNDDSLDLDQLTASEEGEQGRTRLFVAIADVASAVKPDSAVDQNALFQTTSLYAPGLLVPMLPVELSNGWTSLNEDADRAAVVVRFELDEDAQVLDGRVLRALVRSRAKLAYPSVGDWLEGDAPPPDRLAGDERLQATVRRQHEAAQALKASRLARGALELAPHEARPVFEGRRLVDLVQQERNAATELIENLMIAANGVVARFLSEHGDLRLDRVLFAPKRWPDLVELAARHGHSLPPRPSPMALQAFLAERHAKDPERHAELSLSVVKLLGRGEYLASAADREGPGHFGLAVEHYVHSTAPNRRYADLVTQRLLAAALAGREPETDSHELRAVASRCTDRHLAAEKAQRRVLKSAAALLLQDRIDDRFPAVVTGASEKGTWVRIHEPPIEGRLVRGERGRRVGQRLTVRLRSVDVDRGWIDFSA